MSVFGQAIVRQPTEFTWDPRGGRATTLSWVGLRPEINDYSLALIALGVRHQVVELPDGEKAHLTATCCAASDGTSILQPPDEPLATIWGLIGSEQDKSIWTAPKVQAEMEKISSADDRRALRRRMEAYLREEDVVGGNAADAEMPINMSNLVAWANTWSGGTITAGFIQQLAFIMMTGADSVQVSQYVLRRQKVVASNTSIVLDYANVLKYWSGAELIADEGVPTFLLGGLPAGYWIKKTPTAEQAGPGRWSLTQEWLCVDSLFTLLWDHKA